MRERDICFAVWKARKTDADKARLKQVRRSVTRLVRNIKRAHGQIPEHYTFFKSFVEKLKIGWCDRKGPIIFSPDELNAF
jgi:hypothetical protein